MEQEEKKQKDKENVSELTDIILNIIDYYSFKNDIKEDVKEDSEKWKSGTKYDTNEIIPSDIDEEIKKLFLVKIKKLIKK